MPGRRFLRDASALVVGTVIGGLSAYAFVVIGTRTLGAEAFAPISVLWTFWAISAAVITFPVMHWVIRTIEADASEGRIGASLPGILATATTVSVVLGLCTFLARRPLFLDEGWVYPALSAVIPLGSTAVGLARGVLAGRGQFGATGVAIAGENLVRVGAAVVVATAGWGPEAMAVALVTGFAIAVAFPSALVFRGQVPAAADIRPLAFLGGIAGGTLIGQGILTGGPVALAVLGGGPVQITGLFSALAVFRAPYLISTGVATRITGTLTQRVVRQQAGSIRRMGWATSAAAVAGAPAGAAFGWLVGPAFLQLVFGPDIRLSGEVVATVAAGSVLAVAALFATLMLVAGARTVTVTASWSVAAVVAVGWAVAGPGGPLTRVVWAFLLAEMVALLAMLAGVRRLAHDLAEAESPSSDVGPRRP